MTASPLYRFPERMDSLGPLLTHVRAASAGVEPAAVLRAETAAEELLTNSVVHGGGDDAAAPASVWLSIDAGSNVLKLRFEDAFAAFDPLPAIAQALQRTASPMEQRPVGGLGLLMVYRLADEFRYVRENGHNCIDLTFFGARVR